MCRGWASRTIATIWRLILRYVGCLCQNTLAEARGARNGAAVIMHVCSTARLVSLIASRTVLEVANQTKISTG